MTEVAGRVPPWWTAPGQTDFYSYLALGIFFLFVLFVFYLYAVFDRYTEHKSRRTPLKTTIPTLLVIALAYEVLPPLSHFSFLLPLALVATALANDLMVWFSPKRDEAVAAAPEPAAAQEDGAS